MMGHIKNMAEQVVAAGSRTAGLGGLHRYSAESQALEQISDSLFIPVCDTFRISKKIIQIVLKHVPGIRFDRFRAHQVGDHPLGSSRNFGGQISVASRCHNLRSGGDHVNVSDYHQRGRTRECLL